MKDLKWDYSEITQHFHVSNNDAYFTIETSEGNAPFILKDAGREVATLSQLSPAKDIAHIIYNNKP